MRKLSCILLVDDDQTTNYLNQLLLKRLEVTDHIWVAQDGQQALDLLVAQAPVSPALILLDVNMPGMNGFQFLEHYQQLPTAQQQATIIVMLTTSLHPRDVERVQALGVVAGFMSKPLTAEKLRTVLTNYFPAAGE